MADCAPSSVGHATTAALLATGASSGVRRTCDTIQFSALGESSSSPTANSSAWFSRRESRRYGRATISFSMSENEVLLRLDRQPAARTLPTMRRLMCGPACEISGSSRSNSSPRRGPPGRTCLSKTTRPSGRTTRRTSLNPATGSGTEQKTHAARTVSNEASRNARFGTSAQAQAEHAEELVRPDIRRGVGHGCPEAHDQEHRQPDVNGSCSP